jgi:hypothetical protein
MVPSSGSAPAFVSIQGGVLVGPGEGLAEVGHRGWRGQQAGHQRVALAQQEVKAGLRGTRGRSVLEVF